MIDPTFMWQGDSSSSSFRVIVGQPVDNCNGTSSTKSTFTGTVEVGHTFGTETSGGLELGARGPKIEMTITTQTSSKIVKSQSVEITVDPGKIVCDSKLLLLSPSDLHSNSGSFGCKRLVQEDAR
jgi:hypothetical protein